jgi:hypothetical protein
MAEKTPGGDGAPKVPIPKPEKPQERGGSPKTDLICAPLDLGGEDGVGEGTMKQAFVPSDLSSALKDLASAKAEAVPEHLRSIVKGAKKPESTGTSGALRVQVGAASGEGDPPGTDTDKGGPAPSAGAGS